LNCPFINGVNLNALPVLAPSVEGLLLQMFVFLQQLDSLPVLMLRALSQLLELHELTLTVIP
jgi:hypothetical protein